METSKSSTSVWYRRKYAIPLILGVAVLMVAGAGVGVFRLMRDPSVMFLVDEENAKWIVPDRHFEQGLGMGNRLVPGPFRTHFTVTDVPDQAILVVKAMRICEVRLDGEIVLERGSDFEAWKIPREVDLAPFLTPGRHELGIIVFNSRGQTVLQARCDALDLYTDSDWEFNYGKQSWRLTRLASTPTPIALSREFPHVSVAFKRMLPLFGGVFFLVALWSYFSRRNERLVLSAGTWRWVLIVLCSILGINNMLKLELDVGFDSIPHYSYVLHIADHWTVPYAGDGWQMFQAPLFYGVTAVFYTMLSWFFEPAIAVRLLRIVPLICGIAQVEICYRAMRAVYPDRTDVQIVGTTFGALLPMNLYISQVLGNEPMSGLFGGLVCMLLISMLCGKFTESRKALVLFGAVLGAALLSKATSVLLLPITFAVFTYRAVLKHDQLRRVAVSLAIVFGTAGVISAWYYFRNYVRFNSFFVGGWDPVIGIDWWQYPGYRIIDQYLLFGQSLTYPIYSATVGFWDGLYSTFWADGYLSGTGSFDDKPPWNYTPMLTGVWLAFVPITAMAACMVGAVSGLFRNRIPHDESERSPLMAQIFSGGCIAFYIAVVLYLHIQVPHFSSAKATYMTGIIPCYAVLVGGGFRFLRPRSFVWTVCIGLLACWAFAAYYAFFVW